ncbi:MAG: hypothetical protein P4K93_12735 [Terracidiphilus sp.]|nr:hypothetical protein [Terracidiphilus sp.]
MKNNSRLAICFPLALAAILYLSGSKAIGQDQAPPPDQGPDPAAANMAPSGPSYTTEAPPPDGQNPDDSNYAEQPTEEATQPPPPLPDYVQPPPPDDGYIWTPGYWAYGAYGYYWVPGVWVEPPYAGGLWTPGYWGFYSGRYMWYPGHWGMHIGWYGGINYGFGYVGFGYEGGYWNRGHFFYNRVYNNINVRSVHNVYSYRANVRVNENFRGNNNQRGNNNERFNNNDRGNNNQRGNNSNDRGNNARDNNGGRPSYRGGPNGVQAQPRPSEGNAYREPTAPRMNTQMQHEQNYSTQRGQYAAPNNNRPATTSESRPLHADPHVQPQQRSGGGGGRSGGHR